METDQEIADRQLFDAIGDDYARKDVVESTRFARRAILLRALEPLTGDGRSLGTVVDVGCGPGGQALHLVGFYERYIGIDHSSTVIRAAREFTKGLENVEFICANFKDHGLPAGSADTVLMANVLHHMTDLDAVMAAGVHLAKPGGRFVAIEPQRGNPLIQAVRWVRTRLDSHYSADQHFFSEPELRKVLVDGGLRQVRLEFQSYLTQPFATVIMRPQWLFSPLSRLAVALEPMVEKLFRGRLGRLSWLLAAYGTFPGEDHPD